MSIHRVQPFLQSALEAARSERVRQVIKGIQGELVHLQAHGRFDERQWSASARRRTVLLAKDDEYVALEATRPPQTHNDPADDPDLAEKTHW